MGSEMCIRDRTLSDCTFQPAVPVRTPAGYRLSGRCRRQPAQAPPCPVLGSGSRAAVRCRRGRLLEPPDQNFSRSGASLGGGRHAGSGLRPAIHDVPDFAQGGPPFRSRARPYRCSLAKRGRHPGCALHRGRAARRLAVQVRWRHRAGHPVQRLIRSPTPCQACLTCKTIALHARR